MKKFNKLAIIFISTLTMCTNTYGGFWQNEYTIFDENYQADVQNGKFIYETYQKYFKLEKTKGANIEEILAIPMEVSDSELDLMMLGVCNDLYDTTYVDYEFIDLLVNEYGSRHNQNYSKENPMLGMPDLIANQKHKSFGNEYAYRMTFPQETGERVYDVLDPGLVTEIMDRFFEVAPIDDEPDTLYEELSLFLDQNVDADYYYISNHKDMYVKGIGDEIALKIIFENYSRSKIDTIRIESSNPELIKSYENYFRNARGINKWCKIASGDNYIEFHNMYSGIYKINKKLTDEIKRKEREKKAMEESFIQADIDYYNQLFGE